MHPIRLPKAIETDHHATLLVDVLATSGRRLWPGGTLRIPAAQPSDGLWEALRAAHRTGRVVRGLEKTDARLAMETRGQQMADKISGARRGRRISRLIVLAADGSERLYRQVEALIKRHAPRLVAVRLVADGPVLGSMIYGPGSSARVLMIDHKDAVAAVLLALADQWVRPAT